MSMFLYQPFIPWLRTQATGEVDLHSNRGFTPFMKLLIRNYAKELVTTERRFFCAPEY